MPLETNPQVPDDLNEQWPEGTDDLGQGDDHIRNVKTVIKGTGMILGVPYITNDGDPNDNDALVRRDIQVGRLVVAQKFDAAGDINAGLVEIVASGVDDGVEVFAMDNGNFAKRFTEVGLAVANAGNKIVDGKFDFWFEGISQTSSGYGSDTMWQNQNNGSTKTHSQQKLIAGVDLPAIDNPTAEFFSRTEVTSVVGNGNFVVKSQPIENVRTLAGRFCIISFYAKADSTKNIAISLDQQFGLGGSSKELGSGDKIEITNEWKLYKVIFEVPSLDGKTVGTDDEDALVLNFWFDAGSNFDSRTNGLGQQSGTFDIACVQLQEGVLSTKFIEEDRQVSLDRLYRHFVPLQTNDDSATADLGSGRITSSSSAGIVIDLGVEMRVIPTYVRNTFGVNLKQGTATLRAVSGESVSSNSTKRRIRLTVNYSGASADVNSATELVGNGSGLIFFDARIS